MSAAGSAPSAGTSSSRGDTATGGGSLGIGARAPAWPPRAARPRLARPAWLFLRCLGGLGLLGWRRFDCFGGRFGDGAEQAASGGLGSLGRRRATRRRPPASRSTDVAGASAATGPTFSLDLNRALSSATCSVNWRRRSLISAISCSLVPGGSVPIAAVVPSDAGVAAAARIQCDQLAAKRGRIGESGEQIGARNPAKQNPERGENASRPVPRSCPANPSHGFEASRSRKSGGKATPIRLGSRFAPRAFKMPRSARRVNFPVTRERAQGLVFEVMALAQGLD